MADGSLPQPEKRRRATPRQIADMLIRQEGRCNLCPTILADVSVRPIMLMERFDVDHVIALAFLGAQTPDNLQCLCRPCHLAKSRTDNREAKKGARIRGEKGQRARREKRGGSSIKGGGFRPRPSGMPSKLSKAYRDGIKALREKTPIEEVADANA